MNGYLVYEGPSSIDGGPIVGVVTGVRRASSNAKTGPMCQLWILRADEAPLEALRSGSDKSVCGSCALRGLKGRGRACYVRMDAAPGQVWRQYKAGGYPTWKGERLPFPVRLGAYGEPTALPHQLVRRLADAAPGFTGYTHRWRRGTRRFRSLLMASVECERDRERAAREGWRTFRVGEAPGPDEIFCPATEEGGSRALCFTCGLCSGAGEAQSIVVLPHGPGRRYLENVN